MVLVFLFLSGTSVHAQTSQTSVKKMINNHSEQTDKIVGKKIEQNTLSGSRFEKLDTVTAATVKSKPHNRKSAHKKKKKQ